MRRVSCYQWCQRTVASWILTALVVGVMYGWVLPTVVAAESPRPRILASTAWTAAIAEAAGAQDVAVLAPFELRHPPERDFRPSDITRAIQADLIVWAGYEGFIPPLLAAAQIPQSRSLQIATQNVPEHLISLTRELANVWGTEARQALWEAEFVSVTTQMTERAQALDVGRIRVVVVGHLVPFMRWLGYDVVGTFGFEEMTPARIHELRSLQPDMVIDVWHNPTAEPLALATDAPYVALINFPGRDGTRTLLDVFVHNGQQLGLWTD